MRAIAIFFITLLPGGLMLAFLILRKRRESDFVSCRDCHAVADRSRGLCPECEVRLCETQGLPTDRLELSEE